MEFNELIQKAISSIGEGKLEKMTEEKIEKMMDDVLSNIFSYNGTVSKNVKEQITFSLDVNLERFNLAEYNVMIADMINRNLIESVNKGSLGPIQSMIQKTIGLLNMKKIKLSEIIEKFTLNSMEYNSDDEEGEISLFIEKNDKYGWTEVFVDLDSDVSKEKCRYSFIFGNDRYIFSLSDKSRYVDVFNKSNFNKPTELSRISCDEVERILFRVYSARIPIIEDVTIDDLDEIKRWSRWD